MIKYKSTYDKDEGIKMPTTIDIPTCILYNKVKNIDERLIKYVEPSEGDVYLQQIYSRYKHSKKFLTILERNKEKLLHHFGYHEVEASDNNVYRRFYWIAYPNELPYIITGTRNINNSLMSESLDDKIREAIKETKNKETNILMNLFYKIRNIEKDINQDRHFTINKKGEMTFTPKGKQTKTTENDTWKIDGRQSIKYGKGIRKIFENNLYQVPDSIIEYISNNVKAAYTFNAKYKIIEGEDIRYYYHEENNKNNTGSLSQSCMRYDECQNYLDIYVNNPSKVKMLVAIDHYNIAIGRALLWTTDNCPRTVMDRIYGNDLTIEAFKEYAKKNNWVYKRYQNHSDTDDWENAEGIEDDICVTVNVSGINEFPYIDSFRYAETVDNNQITLYTNSDMNNYIFNSTNGGYEGNDRDTVQTMNGDYYDEDDCVFSDYHDQHIYEPEAVYSNYHSAYLYRNDAVRLVNEDWVHPENDDICYSEMHNAYYTYDNVTFIDNISDYVENDLAVQDLHDEMILADTATAYDINTAELAQELNTTETIITQLLNKYLTGEWKETNTYRIMFDSEATPIVPNGIQTIVKEYIGGHVTENVR